MGCFLPKHELDVVGDTFANDANIPPNPLRIFQREKLRKRISHYKRSLNSRPLRKEEHPEQCAARSATQTASGANMAACCLITLKDSPKRTSGSLCAGQRKTDNRRLHHSYIPLAALLQQSYNSLTSSLSLSYVLYRMSVSWGRFTTKKPEIEMYNYVTLILLKKLMNVEQNQF